MDPMTWILLSMGVGALQGEKKRQDAQRWNQAQAEMMRYSPWTGLNPQMTPHSGGALEGAMQGGMTGAALAQGMKRDEMNADFQKKQLELLQQQQQRLPASYSPFVIS